MRKLRQVEFHKAGHMFVRYVENQDKAMKVKRQEDDDESHIYPPHNRDIENRRTQWLACCTKKSARMQVKSER